MNNKRHIIFPAVLAALAAAMLIGCGSSRKDRLYIYNWTYYTPGRRHPNNQRPLGSDDPWNRSVMRYTQEIPEIHCGKIEPEIKP